MRHGNAHLTYCTNIHPGESWAEVAAQLAGPVADVRARFAEHSKFAVGLRLSAAAANALQAAPQLQLLRDTLAANDLYVVSLNGFPYGQFHGGPVKAAVYDPDWKTSERGIYTQQLTRVLQSILPAGETGSISTVPGAFKPAATTAAEVATIAHNLIAQVKHLHTVQRESGALITIALEPEPLCFLETIEETVHFFNNQVWTSANCAEVARALGLASSQQAEAVLRRHLGVCLDACHSAVEFEDPLSAVAKLEAAGIEIAKLQISAAIRLNPQDPQQLAAIREYEDGVYLHQVVARSGTELYRFTDLNDAFAATSALNSSEWRVHFHVPIHEADLAPFQSTQEQLKTLLTRYKQRPFTRHLEVETYTWNVLPAERRGTSVVDSITRELRWVEEQL